MKINNEYYSYDKSDMTAVRVGDCGADMSAFSAGDILEGVVTQADSSVKISFAALNNKEITFDNSAVKNAYKGEKRSFRVVEASADKLVLRDLGGIGSEIAARGALSAQVDLGMPKMVEDFSETMGDIEEEDKDSVKRLSDEDASLLKAEGFSIEDYKSERLVRALERIKTNREAKRESTASQSEKLSEERENVKKQAAKAVADKYAASQSIVEALMNADIPVTDENVNGMAGALMMSNEVAAMSDNSFAYMVRNELQPTIINIYRSVYSGSIKRTQISPSDWEAIKPQAEAIAAKAAAAVANASITVTDAKELVEYDIPLTEDNLIYKKELELLRKNPPDQNAVIEAETRALNRGEEAQDAVLIRSREPKQKSRISELKVELNFQEIRLLMGENASANAVKLGIESSRESILARINDLREEIHSFCYEVARELDISEAELNAAADTASRTYEAVRNISTAPVTLYGATVSVRSEITLEGLSSEATRIKAAFVSYEASQTEIRRDLGDSISKAFGNIDTLIEEAGMDVTEANRRAVKILGHNSMPVTEENISTIKYYDAKITSMIDDMKPSMIMSMIKRGYNPLNDDIDTINEHIEQIKNEEGVSPEEKFSTFLMRMDETNAASDDVRATYIGIYRLLYQIEKTDGAAIGAAINSGKRLTLKNLLTEARTRQADHIDSEIGDETDFADSVYTNSITLQIEQAFTAQNREAVNYNKTLVRRAADNVQPEAWQDAFEDKDPSEMTLEQVAESLEAADKYTAGDVHDAERIRNVMASLSSAKKFLRAFGVNDSVNNIEIVDEMSEDLSLVFADRSKLIETVDDAAKLKDSFEAETERTESGYTEVLLGELNPARLSSELNSQLRRYGLLRDLAGKEHYRMRVDGEAPARVNLTVIHGGEHTGSVSIEVSTPDYHARAVMEISGTDEDGTMLVEGKVTFDSPDELIAAGNALANFKAGAKARGFDATGVSEGLDRLSPDTYLARLARAKDEEEDKPSDSRLYVLARTFIEELI